ncbi:MAG TPA: SpoIIE family protein phosphatase [Candidatus Omnitrophota bacterium]|nr:SpoIIE family protein phosphatase [Candidatus Omnitrophota bacterium]
MRNRSLAFKLAFFILTCSSVILGTILGYNYFVSRQMILGNVEASARDLARETAQKIETVMHSIKEVPETLAEALEEIPYDEETLKRLLRSAVENNDGIFGSTIAFEPNAFDGNSLYFAPYFYRSGRDIRLTWLGGDDYRYFSLDWYQIPKELKRLCWTEPYYDEGGGNIIMSTCSVPFYRRFGDERRFMGVVTADVSLVWLQKMISAIKIAKTGYAFLISKNGTFVTHPRKALIMNETIFSLAESRQDAKLREIGRDMVRGRFGFVPFRSFVNGKDCWMAYAPIPSTGWSVAVVFPRDELMADIIRLNQIDIVLACGGFFILFIVIILISDSITRPLRILARATKDIAKGNWEIELPDLKSKDEVGSLTASFLYMKEALKKYIRELTETTAAKERMESELKIAHDIQMGIVPKQFPPFPERKEFDLYAVLEPAREVGGDFYDFFFIDENRLCFVIGDVSGKGVPAALFMAITKTLIRASAKEFSSSEDILRRVNAEILKDNEACMFVTVFCGILDVQTGEVSYSNGGHNPPLYLRKGKGCEFLDGEHGAALGILENGMFVRKSFFMGEGDVLYLYTDGVTESCDESDKLYSEERLRNFLSGNLEESPKELVKNTLREIRSFSGKMPQADDVTLLVLKYFGSMSAGKLSNEMIVVLENTLSSLPVLASALTEFGVKHGLEAEVINNVNLALEELAVNIISYAYPDGGKHEILIRLEKCEREFLVWIQDDGKPFNPLQVPEPPIEKPLEQKPIGGLGIHIVRNLASNIEYQRREGKNILILKILR